MLAEAVTGIELGEYDRQVLARVSTSDEPVLAALASLIARAGTHRLAEQHESHLAELCGILEVLEDERVFGGEQSPTMRALVETLRLRLGRQIVGR
ncbi:MAG: hypothetical protein QG608_1372 [Actinomycetota bacterium]|nr:hypothetical protein [Actinomycetota bacterium]